VKILLTVMQIVSGFPTVLDLHFPPSSSTLLHGFSFVNFSSLQLGSPQCYTSFDYVSTLQTQTLVPIGIVCLLALAFVLHYGYLTHQKRKRREKVILIRKYTMLVFFITYLTLPAVSTTILGAYPCVTIDPSKELPDQPAARLMKRSYDVSCSSKRYKEGYIWAVVMTIVYPIGVTMMYCFVLYYNRCVILCTIQSRHVSLVAVAVATPGADIASLCFWVQVWHHGGERGGPRRAVRRAATGSHRLHGVRDHVCESSVGYAVVAREDTRGGR
jgi:hypothetical protein